MAQASPEIPQGIKAVYHVCLLLLGRCYMDAADRVQAVRKKYPPGQDMEVVAKAAPPGSDNPGVRRKVQIIEGV